MWRPSLTAGSWSTGSHGVGGQYGAYKVWSGSDRPKISYPKDPVITIHRGETGPGLGKTQVYKIHRRSIHSRPPKRVRDAPHDYTMSTGRGQDAFFLYTNSNGDSQVLSLLFGGTALCRGVYSDGSDFKAGFLDSNDQIKLVGKLREKLYGSDFNAGIVLGEGHESLKMIANTAIRIRKALHHLRRGDIAGTAASLLEGANRKPLKPFKDMKHLRDVSQEILTSNWLELQYGWLPLLKDVEAGAQFLAHALNVPLQTSYRVQIRKEKSEIRFVGGTAPLDARLSWKVATTHRRSLIAIVSEKPSYIAQLGLLNPETVAWELLPWSFVADWFIPIGQYLDARALSSIQAGTFVTSDKIYGTYGDVLNVGNAPNNPPPVYDIFASLSRSVSNNISVPLPSFKGLGQVASWKHCVNAVALLTQLVHK